MYSQPLELQWLKALENTNRFLTTEGQELVGRSDYGTLEQVLDSVVVPVEVRRSSKFKGK